MTVPAPERVEKSTAAVQALLRQLLEMYDAKTLANQLVAHGESHWSPAILKRLLISDRAGHRLSDGEFCYLRNLLPHPPAGRLPVSAVLTGWRVEKERAGTCARLCL